MRPTARLLVISGVSLLSSVLLASSGMLAADDTTAAPKASAVPVSQCLNLQQIRRSTVLDGKTIVFEMHDKRMLVNRMEHTCPGLKFEKRFAYKTSINKLCSLDIITVLTLNGPGASCGLGKFEPYTPPAKPESSRKDVSAAGVEPDKG